MPRAKSSPIALYQPQDDPGPAPSASHIKLLTEDEVCDILRIPGTRRRGSRQRSLDIFWERAQDMRRRSYKPPLTRVENVLTTPGRYLYKPGIVEELMKALEC